MLQDRLVHGVNHKSIQRRLLAEPHDLTFNKAFYCNTRTVCNENARPRFYKPRPIPHTLKEKVELELESLRAQGIISPVKTSSWAAPVVPVLKKNGKVRLYGDLLQVNHNQVSPTETYPLPRADEIYAKLAGGKLFTKLDMLLFAVTSGR